MPILVLLARSLSIND